MRKRCLTPTVLRLDLCRRPRVNQAVKIIVDDVILERSDVDAARRFIADAEHLRPVALGCNVVVTPPAILEPDARVVAPSRSSQTRSVLARFLDRPSGNGIFTEVTRLMALRTSSRSAATAEVNATPSNRLATRRDLNGWNMWVKPSVGKSFQRSGGAQVALFVPVLSVNLVSSFIEGLKIAREFYPPPAP